MKKFTLLFLFLCFSASLLAQDTILPKTTTKPEKELKNVIRLKPFATVYGLFVGVYELDLQYARYAGKKVAIPFEFDIFAGDMGVGFALLTGIEAVPLTHQQKSGLFLQGLLGIIYASHFRETLTSHFGNTYLSEPYGKAGLILNANVGYQLVIKKGFVFNAAVGPMYNTLTNKVAARISLDVGVAF